MSEHKNWKRRLEDKPAKKALAELYGDDLGRQTERYIELAEKASRDIAGGVFAAGARAGGDASDSQLQFYSAPGRTELGGNHTDHNRGRVLCAAVRLDAVACIAPSGDSVVRLVSEGYPDPIVVDLSSLEPVRKERGTTASLVRGVAKAIVNHLGGQRGAPLRGFTGRLGSKVLPGSGLSSSAAIEVLLGTIMADIAGIKVPPVEIAKMGQFAENEYFGKPCGLMDQTASAVGGIVAIDFADPAAPKVKRVKCDFSDEGYELIVVNTGDNHEDLTADYAAIPAEMKAAAAVLGAGYLREVEPDLLIARGPEIRKACGDRAFLRALHFAADNARVVDMVEALETANIDAYLKLVRKSGISSWELLQNIYPPSIPTQQGLSVALALTEGYLGRKGAWRVHGGGFAGTIQAYLPKRRVAGYADLMARYFGPGSIIPISVRGKGALKVRV
jgi:galactokinase